MDVSDEQQFSDICNCTTSGGASRRQGVDLEATVRATDAVRVNVNWTFNDAKYRHFVTEDGETLTDEVRVFNTARYVGAAAVTVAPPTAPWALRVSGNVVGPYTPFDEEPGFELPAYGLMHVAGTWRVARAQLELGLRNIFDRTYPELEAGGFVSPGQPRSVYGGIGYTF